ncbi:hypothetical protein [Haloarchaeobius sp. HRN-SO-5]
MAASQLQVILTALVVLGVTIVPFVWGLNRLINHVQEYETEDDERMV